jgi:hypothetical protein
LTRSRTVGSSFLEGDLADDPVAKVAPGEADQADTRRQASEAGIRPDFFEDVDDRPEDEIEAAEERLVDSASAAQTIRSCKPRSRP